MNIIETENKRKLDLIVAENFKLKTQIEQL